MGGPCSGSRLSHRERSAQCQGGVTSRAKAAVSLTSWERCILKTVVHEMSIFYEISHFSRNFSYRRCQWKSSIITYALKCFMATLGTGTHFGQKQNQKCIKNHQKSTKTEEKNHFSSDRSMICAGGEDKDACQVPFLNHCHQISMVHHNEDPIQGPSSLASWWSSE